MNKDKLIHFVQTIILIGGPIAVSTISRKRDDQKMAELIDSKVAEKLKALPESTSKES